MKVVLDTNVLIDAFRDEYSYQKRIINEIINGSIQAFANSQTLRENHLILGRLVQDESYKRELDNLFSKITWVENKRQVHIVSDPEDNKILESAVQAHADYLITEDHALLEIKEYGGVKIVESIVFWKMYEEINDNPWQKWVKFVSGN